MLRLCWRRVRERIVEAVHAAGFEDLAEAHLPVFSYPLPDGVRPSELARRMGMSRQATNHVLAQMESLGYLERRAPNDGSRRLIYLTDRGWQVGETIFTCLRDLEAEWADQIGEERFTDFMQILRQLATEEPQASLGKQPT